MNLVLNSEMCFYRVHRMENSRLEQVVVVATEAAETGVVVEAVGKTDQHLGILGVVAGGGAMGLGATGSGASANPGAEAQGG
jgi:hypothetical protein